MIGPKASPLYGQTTRIMNLRTSPGRMTSMFNRIARRATAIALASLATVCSAGPGDFDPTFGVAGVSQINCCAVIVSLQQSDGKLIVLDYTQTNHKFVFDPPLAKLIRLNSNGGID